MNTASIILILLQIIQVIAFGASHDDDLDGTPIGGRDVIYQGWRENWTLVGDGSSKFNPGAYVTTVETDGIRTLFAVRIDGMVCWTHFDSSVGQYAPWAPLATNYKMDVRSRISVFWNRFLPGLEVYATAVDGYVWTTRQEYNYTWTDWDPVDTSMKMGPAAPLSVMHDYNTTIIEIVGSARNGSIITTLRSGDGPWTEWAPIRNDVAVPPSGYMNMVGNSLDDTRFLYIVDWQGQARRCPWVNSSWQYCIPVHPRRMRPGAYMVTWDYRPTPLLVTTSDDGHAWFSDDLGAGSDWYAVDSSSALAPGAEPAIFVLSHWEWLFGTDRNGVVKYTMRTRDDNYTINTPWPSWSSIPAFDQIPAGAQVNVASDHDTARINCILIGKDGNVWRNFWG